MKSPREAALLEAVRVCPNTRALDRLRDFLSAMEASDERDDLLTAGALRLLIEQNDKVVAVLAEHGRTP